MPAWALYLLLFIAIAVGFVLGKRHRNSHQTSTTESPAEPIIDSRYFKGLNHLLNEQPDYAIETFISALEVNVDTLQTHLALGNFLCRKGEVDRAIRIHQNLLAHPNLTIEQSHQAQYALATDFLKAGLFDRAKRLLKELVASDGHYRVIGLTRLLDVYRDEREWCAGLDVMDKLAGSRFSKQYEKWSPIKAHFCCEMAAESMSGNGSGNSQYLSSRKWLKRALAYDKQSVRARLSLGKLEIDAGYYNQGINQLQKICHQQPDYLPEALPYLLTGYKQLNNITGYRDFLLAINSQHSSDYLRLAIVDIMAEEQGPLDALEFIVQQMEQNPSMIVLDKFLHLYSANVEGEIRHYMQLAKTVIAKAIEENTQYVCQHCGFKGKQLHWLCPSCKQWRVTESREYH